jgi:uncharacterized protein YdhG (YjbR/CyaY superfamily)
MRTGQPEPSPSSIDQYIAGFPPNVQQKLEQMRGAIRAAAPEAEETIKYSIPTFVLQENLVHFAAFAKHVGFYPAPSGIAAFKDELSEYKGAKGSVQFPIDKPIPLTLIKKIVRFRVQEVRAKSAAKKRS